MKKFCTRCETEKPLESFSKCKSRKDGLAVHCKVCANELNKVSYKKKPELYAEMRKRSVERHIQSYRDWKAAQHCAVCGETESVCLDLHHIDSSEKDFNVSEMIYRNGWDVISNEIQKCVVLCANCHRKVHGGIISIAV